jgi:hypothetical protein
MEILVIILSIYAIILAFAIVSWICEQILDYFGLL